MPRITAMVVRFFSCFIRLLIRLLSTNKILPVGQ
jgi:hypothetical protein